MEILLRAAARPHMRGSKRRRPCRPIPRLGFDLGAKEVRVRILEEKLDKGQELRLRVASMKSGASAPVLEAPQTASILNFRQWLALGGFCHLRSGRAGKTRADR